MYDTVLFPTDGSEESLVALDHALGLATTNDADLHSLYVVDNSYPYGDFEGGVIDIEPIIESFRAEGERALDRIDRRAEREGIAVTGVVREGTAIHRVILEYADEVDADIIVMATHGRRGLDRWFLGSITERVVRTANCPVLTVRSSGTTEE